MERCSLLSLIRSWFGGWLVNILCGSTNSPQIYANLDIAPVLIKKIYRLFFVKTR